MDFFIKSIAEQYIHFKKEKTHRDPLAACLLIVSIAFIISAVSAVISTVLENMFAFWISFILLIIFIIIFGIMGYIHNRRFNKQDNLKISMQNLNYLYSVLKDNSYVKIKTQQDIRNLYAQVQGFYNRKFSRIEAAQKTVLHITEIMFIPLLLAVINYLLTEESISLEQKFAWVIVLMSAALFFIFCVYKLFEARKLWIEIKNTNYKALLDALEVLSTFEFESIS